MSVVLATGSVLYPGITWTNWISYATIVVSSFLMISTFFGGKFYYDRVKSKLL
jgi:hypothetical protein